MFQLKVRSYKIKGEGRGGRERWEREVGLAGVGWREGEKMQTIVTE